MEVGIEFVFCMVGMERLLVVFLKKSESQGRGKQSLVKDVRVTRCLQYFGENLRRWLSKVHSIFVTDRSFIADGGLL